MRTNQRDFEHLHPFYPVPSQINVLTADAISLFVDLAGTAVEVCDLLLSRSVVTLKLMDVLKLRSSDTVELLFGGMGRLLMREDERVRIKRVAVAADTSLYGSCDEVWG